jgi:hypothetical protein
VDDLHKAKKMEKKHWDDILIYVKL